MSERWRPVVGFEGLYEVSDLGRVRSLSRFVRSRGGFRMLRGRVLAPQRHNSGYVQVQMGGCVHLVHTLVLLAFVGPRPASAECAHGDGDRWNNRLSNLRWATHAENCADTVAHGKSGKGERNTQARLTETEVGWIRDNHAYFTQRALAGMHGVRQQTISKIVNRKRWT